MSWHYSQALAAEFSAQSYSAGEPSALSNSTPTPAASSLPDRMMDACPPFQYGTTCGHSTEDLGLVAWMSSLADSPVRTSVLPAKAKESKEHEAACGDTWPESFARWDHASCSWRTPQCSLLADLDVFSETWPRWGMMRAGVCLAQAMPEPHTDETASGFWPTPTVCGNYNRKGASKKSGNGLATAVKQWPTPCASDNRDRGHLGIPAIQRRLSKGKQIMLSMSVSDTSGALNPLWVEWLMGWPIGWTDYAASGTDRFQRWLRSHGKL